MKYEYTELLSFRIIQAESHIKRKILQCFTDLGYNITFEQWTILSVLYNHPGIIQSRIGEITSKDKSNVSRILDRLEETKYISRLYDENDKRVLKITLSKKGENLIVKLIPYIQKLNDDFHNNTSESDYRIFLKVLNEIASNSDYKSI